MHKFLIRNTVIISADVRNPENEINAVSSPYSSSDGNEEKIEIITENKRRKHKDEWIPFDKRPSAMGIWQRILILVVCANLCAAKSTKPLERPNIVFMIVDDLGWNDVSFHGSKQIPTPNIDALARDGVILNQYYVQPTCSPSRGSLMTGKYPIQFGFQHQVIGADEPWGLSLKEKILPQYLKDLGYTSHAVGKWHLGFFKKGYLPLQRGFDSFFGYYAGVEDYYTHFANTFKANYTGLDLHDNEKEAPEFNGTYGTELFTSKAKKVIQEHNSEKPLFLYFAQQAPHTGNFDTEPLQVPEKYVKPLHGIKDEKRRKFAGMVSAMDHSVGKIFQALQKSRMLDNTIFIFTTDNGGVIEPLDGAPGSNWPLRGTKYNLWEGGIRGAAFIWSPILRRKRRIYNGLMHISDWLPTLLSAAGEHEASKMVNEINGVDQWPSLTHILPSPRAEILLNIDEVDGIEGIRKDNYKLIKGSYYDGLYDGWYDANGVPINNSTVNGESFMEKRIYTKNYVKMWKRSKVALILFRKYGKIPSLKATCMTPTCKEELEVKCGGLRPLVDTCKPKEGPCLFDVIKDPCEFYNIAKQFPGVTASLEKAIDKYRHLMVPAAEEPVDPKADPKLHGNVWIPWQ